MNSDTFITVVKWWTLYLAPAFLFSCSWSFTLFELLGELVFRRLGEVLLARAWYYRPDWFVTSRLFFICSNSYRFREVQALLQYPKDGGVFRQCWRRDNICLFLSSCKWKLCRPSQRATTFACEKLWYIGAFSLWISFLVHKALFLLYLMLRLLLTFAGATYIWNILGWFLFLSLCIHWLTWNVDLTGGPISDAKTTLGPAIQYWISRHSPINFLEKLWCPIILFQWLEDKVSFSCTLLARPILFCLQGENMLQVSHLKTNRFHNNIYNLVT
jgi:hypothetical protein